MAKKYIVDLSKDEKAELVSLTQKGRPGAKKTISNPGNARNGFSQLSLALDSSGAW